MTATRRSRRFLTSTALALSLTLAATISPAFGHGSSTPRWTISAVPMPGTVSVGDVVAFAVTITNNSDGDGDLMDLDATTPAGATLLSSTVSLGACLSGTSLHCGLGLIAVGTSRNATVVYRTPTSGSSLAVKFLGNGDDDHINVTATATLSTDANLTSRYVFDNASKSVFTNQSVGGSNPQSTLVNAPVTGIVVSVGEAPGTAICPTSRPCFSQQSEIHVGNGATYPAGFKVVIKLDASEIPHGVHWWNIGIAHQFDNGSWETLSRCSFCWWSFPPNHIPCFIARPLWGGDIEVTMWLTQNGRIRAY